jgi:hypothetical protein
MKGSFGLNQILGVFMYPFALLLGLPWGEAWIVAQQIKTPKIWFKPKLPFIPIQLPTNPVIKLIKRSKK